METLGFGEVARVGDSGYGAVEREIPAIQVSYVGTIEFAWDRNLVKEGAIAYWQKKAFARRHSMLPVVRRGTMNCYHVQVTQPGDIAGALSLAEFEQVYVDAQCYLDDPTLLLMTDIWCATIARLGFAMELVYRHGGIDDPGQLFEVAARLTEFRLSPPHCPVRASGIDTFSLTPLPDRFPAPLEAVA